MRFSLLTVTLLLASGALFLAALFLILPSSVTAVHWDISGGIRVAIKTCDLDSECGLGQYCFNFECLPCSGGCPVCQAWQPGGGCSCVNDDEASCGGGGFFCAGGGCVDCQPAGYGCTGAGGCCSGLLCDDSNVKCASCDANNVQIAPPVDFGGGKCEASCGASSQCDELAPGTFVSGGVCNAQCQWVDGDASLVDCTNAVGPGFWNLGGEIAPTTCCTDDLGEFKRWKQCAPGVCVDNLADDACCKADTKCAFGSTCYYDIGEAITGTVAENTAACNSYPTEAACTSIEERRIKCRWVPSIPPPNCVAADTRAAVLYSQAHGGGFAAYADVNVDGSQDVCVAGSPGRWRFTSGNVTGIVRNVTDLVAGATIRVLGTPSLATSAADGSYLMVDVRAGAHDVVASKTGYTSSVASGVVVPDGGNVTVNFVLVQSLGSDCEDDCTTVGSNLCDAGCHGKGLCWFDSEETRVACDGAFGIIELAGGLNVDCCEGQPYSPVKADISVPSKDVIVSKKPVLYRGKFINMVMVVFNR